ncbi:MAG: hypothetical protein M3297_03310 [Thermoproteota archaeon]|jgi:hypothetical protein|nr:hypothetical protein [Thermoproteota archaeon]
MIKEHNDNDNDDEDYSVTSDDFSTTSEKDLFKVFKALESLGFRLTDYHEN